MIRHGVRGIARRAAALNEEYPLVKRVRKTFEHLNTKPAGSVPPLKVLAGPMRGHLGHHLMSRMILHKTSSPRSLAIRGRSLSKSYFPYSAMAVLAFRRHNVIGEHVQTKTKTTQKICSLRRAWRFAPHVKT